MPPIESKPKTSPKDFFLYLGAIVTLYVSTGTLLALLFNIIDYLFPDRLQYYIDPYSTAIRFAIAALVIIFPIYLLISWYIGRDVRANPHKREISIRKWLIYLTLFLAAAIIVGDLVVLINTFLGGEITTRFIWKVLSVLVVFGAIFGYYGVDLKKKDGFSARGAKIYGTTALILILVTVVGGFMVMGSPTKIREIKFDQQRISDLQSIQSQVLNYWQQKRVLPASLADVNNPLKNFAVPTDPETGQSYEYKVVSNLSFDLCANFGSDSNVNNSSRTVPVPDRSYSGLIGDENWQHGIGRACFTRTIDPALYPQSVTNVKMIQ